MTDEDADCGGVRYNDGTLGTRGADLHESSIDFNDLSDFFGFNVRRLLNDFFDFNTRDLTGEELGGVGVDSLTSTS
jgi:hypothetical protein